MLRLTDKQICIFTMILHIVFVFAARILIDHYQDGFLILLIVSLIFYFIFLLWVYRGKCIHREVLAVYVVCVVIQAVLTQCFGVFGYGYLGKLDFGSGMAVLVYGAVLVTSCVLLPVINAVKWIVKK